MQKQKIILIIGILISTIAAALYLIIKIGSAQITTFEECKKAGWLVRNIKIYDKTYDSSDSIEKECMLWGGKSFVKEKSEEQRAIEIAIAPISYPVTVIEIKKMGCEGCFSITLQRNDNQRKFIITLDNWTNRKVEY